MNISWKYNNFFHLNIQRTGLFPLILSFPTNYEESGLTNYAWEQHLQNITKLASNSDALGGSPAPSTIQGNSGDPLLSTVFALDVIISFNQAYKISKIIGILTF